MKTAWIVVAALSVLAVTALPITASTRAEPASIEPWHKIGDIGLGMLRTTVDYRYGRGSQINEVQTELHVPGGNMIVGFAANRVTSIYTTSSHYRTPDGVGVGTQIPLGPCHRTPKNQCERRWNGFVYYPTPQTWQLDTCYAGVPVYASLSVRTGGFVQEVLMGYGSAAVCTNVNLPPLGAADKRAITRTIEEALASPDITPTAVSGFVTPRSTREYAGATIYGRYKTGGAVQPAFVIVRHHGGKWRVVSYGTSGVGCGLVPIKYLAEMNLNCP